MESVVPPDVQEFQRACDTIVRFAHAHNGLTEGEREVVVNVARWLKQKLAPPRPAPGRPALGGDPLQHAADRLTLWTVESDMTKTQATEL